MGSLNAGNGSLGVLSGDQVYGLIVAAGAGTDPNGAQSQDIGGVRYSQAEIMTAIAHAESGWDPNNVGDQTLSPYGSRGLWQIFTGVHPPSEFGLGSGGWSQGSLAQIANPQTNADAAMEIFHSQGYRAWSTYNSGAFEQYLPQAAQAEADGGAPVSANSTTTSKSSGSGGILGTGVGPNVGPDLNPSDWVSSLWSDIQSGAVRVAYFLGGTILLIFFLWKAGGKD